MTKGTQTLHDSGGSLALFLGQRGAWEYPHATGKWWSRGNLTAGSVGEEEGARVAALPSSLACTHLDSLSHAQLNCFYLSLSLTHTHTRT